MFRQLKFRAPNAVGDDFVEFPLDQPLSLEVGNDGIIGRRVSMFSRISGKETVIAEGVVGFNFLNYPAL